MTLPVSLRFTRLGNPIYISMEQSLHAVYLPLHHIYTQFLAKSHPPFTPTLTPSSIHSSSIDRFQKVFKVIRVF